MRRVYFFLVSLLLSAVLCGLEKPEDPTTELAAEASPAGLIAGCVDVCSGGFVLRDSDVHSYGPDPLSFTRVYSSNVVEASYWGDYSGSTVNYRYQGGQLSHVERQGYIHHYQDYDGWGRARRQRLIGRAGGLDCQRDLLGKTTQVSTAHWSLEIPAGGYDAVGLLLERQVKDGLGSFSQSIDYDPWYQVKAETGAFERQYRNDSLSNVLSLDGDQRDINRLNQLLQVDDRRYVYDLNGNLLSEYGPKGERRYRYDALDRLIAIEEAGQTVHFSYDPLHRCLSKRVESTVSYEERYLYDGDCEIGAYDPSGRFLSLRVLGKGIGCERGAAVLLEIEGQVYAPVHDPIGNVACLVHADTGDCVQTYRLSAYGECTQSHPNLANPWVFSSKREDPETGLVYFGRRYYSPGLCRWITADPGRFDDGSNLYAYVHGNPYSLFDPYGLDSWWQDCKEFFKGMGWGVARELEEQNGGIFFGGAYFEEPSSENRFEDQSGQLYEGHLDDRSYQLDIAENILWFGLVGHILLDKSQGDLRENNPKKNRNPSPFEVGEFLTQNAASCALIFSPWSKGKLLQPSRVAAWKSGRARLNGTIDKTRQVFNKYFNTQGKNSPKGLIGREFEDYLKRTLGGKGAFKIGGREFDGAIGNRWYEAKSGRYWQKYAQPGRGFDKFKSDMGARKAIAKQHEATYELHSNSPIPEYVKKWLIEKEIPFTEY